MKRNLIAVVLFGLASAQAGLASAGGVLQNGVSLNGAVLQNGVALNGVNLANGVLLNGAVLFNGVALNGATLQNGVVLNGMNVQANRLGEHSLDRMPSSADRSESLAAHVRSECSGEPERCELGMPRSRATQPYIESVTLPDGSIFTVR
jgi:hypothetical protein